MLPAKIVFAVAALNLTFLLTELAVNVFRSFFG
jgi:hypothetical protein